MSWLDLSSTSNRFIRMYVQGFVDISGGNLIVRNNDVSFNNRLVVGSDITTNKRLFTVGDTSHNGNLFVAFDTSLNSRLVVGSDITTNSRLFVSGNVGIGTTAPTGKIHIYETTGTTGNATTGTIVLEHNNTGGTSSIIFKSKNNAGSDYGYIYYTDDISGSTTSERSALCIGAENDKTGTTNNDMLILQRNGGYVGIATGSINPTYNLQVNGTVAATSYNATSDYRIKANLHILDDNHVVDYLKPVIYYNTNIKKQDIGFIAHEVQQQFPFLVTGEKDGSEHQTINYTGLIGILTKEIQDLKKEVKEIRKELASYKP